jgi:hypothetical protein
MQHCCASEIRKSWEKTDSAILESSGKAITAAVVLYWQTMCTHMTIFWNTLYLNLLFLTYQSERLRKSVYMCPRCLQQEHHDAKQCRCGGQHQVHAGRLGSWTTRI